MNKVKVALVLLTLTLLGIQGCTVVVVPASCAVDTSTITEWLPTIIEFAMLGMILGLLGKFTKGKF